MHWPVTPGTYHSVKFNILSIVRSSFELQLNLDWETKRIIAIVVCELEVAVEKDKFYLVQTDCFLILWWNV